MIKCFNLLAVILCVSFLLQSCQSASIPNDQGSGFMDSLSTGFKFATKLMGMNQASSVANLVSQAFAAPQKQSTQTQYEDSEYSSNDKDNYVVSTDKSENTGTLFNGILDEQQQSPNNPSTTTESPLGNTSMMGIASLLKVLGMDEKKLTALMVNGLIFIAQMIQKIIMSPGSSSPTTGSEGKQGRMEDPPQEDFDVWELIMGSGSRDLKRLIEEAQHTDLPQKLASFVEGQEMEAGELACVQLLICQTAPILRKMQDSVSDRIQGRGSMGIESRTDGVSIEDSLLGKLPSVDELRDNGHQCEKRYSACDLRSIN